MSEEQRKYKRKKMLTGIMESIHKMLNDSESRGSSGIIVCVQSMRQQRDWREAVRMLGALTGVAPNVSIDVLPPTSEQLAEMSQDEDFDPEEFAEKPPVLRDEAGMRHPTSIIEMIAEGIESIGEPYIFWSNSRQLQELYAAADDAGKKTIDKVVDLIAGFTLKESIDFSERQWNGSWRGHDPNI